MTQIIPPIGARIRLLEMPNDPNPISVGSEGTVTGTYIAGPWTQIAVAWDDPTRSLCLTVPPDRFEVI